MKYRLYILFIVISIIIPIRIIADNQYDFFWFLYEREQSYNEFYTVRPFYHCVKSDFKDYMAIIPPIIYSSYKTDKQIFRNYFFGLSNNVLYEHGNNTYDFDLTFFFPLIFYGKSNNNPDDNYLMIWPFGGSIKGKLAQDEISPWVFPGAALFFLYPPATISTFFLYTFVSWIPLYTSYTSADFKGHAVLWPLVQWGRSSNRSSLRILPFYSRYRKNNFYDNRSFLLLFNFRETYYKNRTEETFFFFPFIGRKWSNIDNINAATLLWPFFTWGYDRKSGYYNLNFMWPFFQYAESHKPEMKKLFVIPFYGKYKYENNETCFITPLYFSKIQIRESYNIKNRYYGILAWHFRRESLEDDIYYGKIWNFYKLWPLFEYESNDRGDFSFKTLSLLPFRDLEGYERIYSPFWSLLEYSSFNGNKKFGLFFRTYFQYWNEDLFISKVPFIYSYKSYKEDIFCFTVFFEMFGTVKNEKGAFFKIFYFPVKYSDDKFIIPGNDLEDGKKRLISYYSPVLSEEIYDNVQYTYRF